MYSEIRKSHRNTPSFSSSLLDEICRSIDDKPASLSRVEKWIESDRTVFRRRPRSVFPETSTANYPRPIRTGDRYMLDDYEKQERNISATTENLIKSKSKSKSRAMRIYSKMKQPISPGARLTTFLSSIFNRNKSKGVHPPAPPANTKLPAKFACRTQTQMNNDALPNARPPLPPNAFQNTNYNYTFEEEEEESDGEAISESSSDLFELDHSSLFGIKDSFCQDLPLYQTTSFHLNR